MSRGFDPRSPSPVQRAKCQIVLPQGRIFARRSSCFERRLPIRRLVTRLLGLGRNPSTLPTFANSPARNTGIATAWFQITSSSRTARNTLPTTAGAYWLLDEIALAQRFQKAVPPGQGVGDLETRRRQRRNTHLRRRRRKHTLSTARPFPSPTSPVEA